MTRWMAYARESLRGIWFRASLFTVVGIVLAIVSHPLGELVPPALSGALGTDAAGTILEILATSMLAVTTFSLTTMVSAYATATQIGTPRSIQLLIADRTSHNALSTFVGAFAFSIVGIVALSMKVYDESGKAVLFLGIMLVIVTVLVTLLRWISFLTVFGRMSDIIDRVENAACRAMEGYADDPLMGANPWTAPPAQAVPVASGSSGFVTHVDMAALQRVAEQQDCTLWVQHRAGARIVASHPVVVADRALSEEAAEAVRHAFVIAAHRTFEQDPRLGLIALSEISSRALSPAVNDPGTGVEVLAAQQRVLDIAVRSTAKPELQHPRVHVRRIEAADLLKDAFRPIARDGAGVVEVALRIQRELGALLDVTGDADWARALRAAAREALERAEHALSHDADIDDVRTLHAAALQDSQPTGGLTSPE
ncbi:hypothetical protein AA310_18310 [Arthrobacter sp. YC-RL1]|uniref:DUF2254 domain-containing protein n=1 Tax=Arthrobacter sp. YC-RL1 TaxID=1652545 RepID=UPI00063DD96F|nr:DUF2254 domain-containing protein [Arthrobacter sp. YC-RL1]ALQ31361.1 hypothetical protein ATC04_12870 [Arthrobacter sp. YC-RL1]KLI87367.1 hypothetical protein AA310_18310 [Arthrobacter sp. YC-RL1]